MKSSATSDAPFAADGGLAAVAPSEADPYRSLDELMAAVEALCPVWPPRTEATLTGRMRL